MALRYCHLYLIKQNCLPKTLLKNYYLTSHVFLYLLPLLDLLELNLKLYFFYLTPKLVKNVITNLGSSKASGLFLLLAEIFNMYLTESCFSNCFKVSFVVPQFKETDGKRLKTTALLVFFL